MSCPYLCAVFAPKKPHISLSILENVSSPLLPSPRKRVLPVPNFAVCWDSVTIFLLLGQPSFQGVFSPFSPSFLCSELIWTSFSLVPAPLGWAEWLNRELGRAPGLQREGPAGEETGVREWSSAAVGPPTAPRRGLRLWHATGKETLTLAQH